MTEQRIPTVTEQSRSTEPLSHPLATTAEVFEPQPIAAAVERAEASDLPGVFIKTYGCQMNEYDTEKMLTMLAADHRVVTEPQQADVVIVNTCSVREKGEHKLFSFLGELSLMKKARPGMVLGVSGCVAQQEGAKILKRNRAVDFIIGTHNLSLVPELVRQARAGAPPAVAVDYREEWEELPDEFGALDPIAAAQTSTHAMLDSAFFSPVRALIAIQRGCDKKCSFCVVPTTRGPQVSRAPDEVLKEIRLKVRRGAKEVLLLGQTVNSYGLDLKPRVRFEELIQRVAELDGVQRIRFISPHPAEVRPGFIDLYEKVPQLVPHIHLPLQSGSDRILKLMNRNYRVERYLEICRELRERVPNISITTDVIVGFPTETEEDFLQTLEVVKEVRFAMSFTFKYSTRPNTRANQDFSSAEEVPDAVAHRRLLELQVVQDQFSRETNDRFVGQAVQVLVEQVGKTLPLTVKGRIPQNTPVEVQVSAESIQAGTISSGSLITAKVLRATPYGLRAEAIES